ncbi:hypothetical protein MTsDn1_20220 [Alteromonas sp. MTD1]|uniref:ATP-binding protein n=1 Tax=Alteromonas sp. MTD1 TaxID=3057962 RepID=UPI0036F2091D
MRKRTEVFVVSLAKVFGSFLLFFSLLYSNSTFAFGATLQGKTKFSGIPSGIIRDIEVIGDATYIASENGVFRILGSHSELIPFGDKRERRGTLSDLYFDNQNTLWLVEYGVGVFSKNLITGETKEHFTQALWPKFAWKIVESENYLIVSLIKGFLVVDKYSGEVLPWGKVLEGVKNVFSIAKVAEHRVMLSSSNFLFIINLKDEEISKYAISEYFPKLSSISVVSIFKDHIFIGGAEGIYRISSSLDTATKIFFPIERTGESVHDIDDIFFTKDERILVAAGGLYELNDEYISVPNYMAPLLNSESIKSIVKISETSRGEVLLASSQLGLIALTHNHKSINLVHEGNVVLRENIKRFGTTIDGRAFVTTNKGDKELSLSSGEVSDYVDTGIDCETIETVSLRYPVTALPSSSIDCGDGFKFKFSDGDSAFLYHENGEESYFTILNRGGVTDRLPAPPNVVNAFLSSSGEIVGFDSSNSVFMQMTRFNWRTFSPNAEGWGNIHCLIEYGNEYLVCTSGYGIRSINKNTGEVGSSKILEGEDVRFIRGGIKSDDGHLWFITNMGLYSYSTDGDLALYSEAQGIFDSDFEYGGIAQLGNKVVVLGDRYSYILDEDKAISSSSKALRDLGEVIISKVTIIDSQGDVKILSSHALTAMEPIELEHDFNELEIVFQSNNLLPPKVQNLEFRILGLDDTWKMHPKSQAYLSLSELDYGDYQIEARLPGELNVVAKFAFKVMKPFYFQPLAISLYFILFIVVSAMYRLNLIQPRWKQFQTTKLYKALTRYEITDGQSKFEKMLRSKELVISDITHELRTPLQIIKSTIDEVGDSPVQKVKAITSIEQNMKRIELLIDQLNEDLPIAKNKRENYRAYTVEAARMIVYSLDPLANQKRQNLEIRTRGNKELSIALLSDSLEKILTNLVQNAIKYTPEHGNIRVVVSLDSKHLKIVVSDNGPGIPKHQQSNIFNRFTRGKTQENGEGIGLSIVKSLVDLNQGSITLDSEGEGCKFTVILPVDDIEFINSQSQVDLADDSQKRRKSLLIVEDDREFRTFLFDLLSPKHRCLVAKNGKQALDVLNRFMVDLIITDQIMSEMDGLALAREVRNHNVHANTPILMLTAKNDRETERLAIEEKIDYFLTKPVSNDEIKLRVEHLLSVRESQQGSKVSSDIPVFKYGCLKIPEFTNEKDMAFYLNFIAVLEKNYHEETFSRDQAAEQLLMSGRSLNRRMAELFEYNFSEFLSRYRVEKSIPLLLEGKTTLDTCLDVGFGTATYFSTSFKKVMKLPPKKYIEQYHKTAVEQC